MFCTKRDTRRTIGKLKGIMREGGKLNLDPKTFNEMYRLWCYANKSKRGYSFFDILRDNFNNFSKDIVTDKESAEKEIAYMCYYLLM